MQDKSKILSEYGRGIVGGILFSLPLLYTMEVWWTGFIASPEKLLAFVGATFLLLLGYNFFVGVREDSSLGSILWDSIEEIGLAFIISALFLLMINKIGFGMSFAEISGKVIAESMMVAIGISIGKAQLGQKGEEDEEEKPQKKSEKKRKSDLHILILGLCGAVLIASSVAPTEEILIIAIVINGKHQLAMVFVSLLLSLLVLFFSEFRGATKQEMDRKEMFLHLLITYFAALVISFFFLWIFGRLEGQGIKIIIAQVIVLGIPASLGASAGRLLISK